MKKVLFYSALLLTLFIGSCEKESVEIQQSQNQFTEVILIGSWNMNEDQAVLIPFNNVENIISVDIIIYSDEGNKTPLIQDGSYITNINEFVLIRKQNGYFDQSAFSSTSINRGLITIHYKL